MLQELGPIEMPVDSVGLDAWNRASHEGWARACMRATTLGTKLASWRPRCSVHFDSTATIPAAASTTTSRFGGCPPSPMLTLRSNRTAVADGAIGIPAGCARQGANVFTAESMADE